MPYFKQYFVPCKMHLFIILFFDSCSLTCNNLGGLEFVRFLGEAELWEEGDDLSLNLQGTECSEYKRDTCSVCEGFKESADVSSPRPDHHCTISWLVAGDVFFVLLFGSYVHYCFSKIWSTKIHLN